MKRFTLTQRLSGVFALLLLACCGASAWLQIAANSRYEQEVVQRLSSGLAQHIAGSTELMDASGWKPGAVRSMFDMLMTVNPAVEVYLLSSDGRIVGDAAPPGQIKRERVDLGPVKRLLAGGMLPITGDDPRSADAQKVFSAAPVRVDGRERGYVYVVLQGQAHDALAMDVSRSSVLRTTLWSIALVALLGLVAGLAAFALITRPLRGLTRAVRAFEGDDGQALAALEQPGDASARNGDEIAVLRRTFAQMGRRISEQWRELTRQDQQRRDLVANISHDLRTPLTSLHGYLETLRFKDETLAPAERRRYLDIALAQSRKVGRLAQELFELARLESGLVRLEPETFSLPELVQDVMQKFELAAEARQQRLSTDIAQALPPVRADLGLIERVLTNLLDNAIRHSPPGGRIELQLGLARNRVRVQVSDSGAGIPDELRAGLFTRASALNRGPSEGGGLGLVIVQRILQLHQSEIRLVDDAEGGAVFQFELAAATPA
ncbi:HAMP domain-containing histidine kinase [Achromobacter mucicolens]|uniref:histidine kinase n=1 Tax=Achromobacter mucicolens TaxID=1389922 RepID=A0ABD4YU73_9BURK|nr:HAMP domain-containing sensor histidine kinase [Achromobacter mucicolens]MDH1178845.1 HAMP domain-containing histidine kinase [Achromobacter mucicolens]